MSRATNWRTKSRPGNSICWHFNFQFSPSLFNYAHAFVDWNSLNTLLLFSEPSSITRKCKSRRHAKSWELKVAKGRIGKDWLSRILRRTLCSAAIANRNWTPPGDGLSGQDTPSSWRLRVCRRTPAAWGCVCVLRFVLVPLRTALHTRRRPTNFALRRVACNIAGKAALRRPFWLPALVLIGLAAALFVLFAAIRIELIIILIRIHEQRPNELQKSLLIAKWANKTPNQLDIIFENKIGDLPDAVSNLIRSFYKLKHLLVKRNIWFTNACMLIKILMQTDFETH